MTDDFLRGAKIRQLDSEAAANESYSREALAQARVYEQAIATTDEATRWQDTQDIHHGYIQFHQDITDTGCVNLSQLLRRQARLYPGKPIEIELCSPGGEITAGIALFDTMLEIGRKQPITIKTRGEVCSMAAILLQAAKNRIAGPHSFIMLHRASFGVEGGADKVEDTVAQVKMNEAVFYGILAERTGTSASSWKKKLGRRKDVWYTAQEALKVNLIDAIG